MDLLTYKELVASKGLCPWSPGYSKLKEAGLDENFIFAKKKIAVGRYKLLLFRIQGGTLAQIGELLKFKKPQHIVWPVMGRCFAAYLSRIIEQLVHHLELRQEADKYIPFVKLTEYIGIGGYTIGDKPDGLSTIRIAYRNGRIYYLGWCPRGAGDGNYYTIHPVRFISWLADNRIVDTLVANCVIAQAQWKSNAAPACKED